MRVYVHGNCQAPAIAKLIQQQCTDWDIAAYEVFSEKILQEIDRYHHYVETADVIIAQPVHDGYRDRDDLSLNWVRGAARRARQIVIFPSMFFDGQLVACRSTKIPAYGMPYQDALFIHLVAANRSLEEITKLLSADDLYPESFIDHEIARSIAEMERRERVDGIDLPISPFLATYGRSTQIFHVINHPYRPALAYVANEALRYLGYPAHIPLAGEELLRFPHIPLPPSVARLMHTREPKPANWEIGDKELYHLPAEKLTRAEYYAKLYAHLKRYSWGELTDCLQVPHVRRFLQDAAEAMPFLPNIDMWREGRPDPNEKPACSTPVQAANA